MSSRFEYRPYRRRFLEPLRTSLGEWEVREGFVLRLEDREGVVGFGEVAPIPWFGTETLDNAKEFLSWASEAGVPDEVPRDLPCCRFAISCCRGVMRPDFEPVGGVAEIAGLLPSGNASHQRMSALAAEGFRVFKWKAGVLSFAEEHDAFQSLVKDLPVNGRLRIDANGGWNLMDAWRWLEALEGEEAVEFVEDPLEHALWEATWALCERFETSLALDLPITSEGAPGILGKGWPGHWVIKPSLFGCVKEVQELTRRFSDKVVFSTALETLFGYEAVLRLALANGPEGVALGLGGQDLFEDDALKLHPSSPTLHAGRIGIDAMEQAWGELQ